MLCLFTAKALAEQPIAELSQTQTKFAINKQISYVEADPELSIDQLLKNSRHIHWQHNQNKTLSLNSSDNAYWIKFKVKNTSISRLDRYLNIALPVLDEVTTYLVSDDGSQIKYLGRSGIHVPVDERSVRNRNFVFPFTLQAQQQAEIYVRVTNDGFIQLPMTIWQENAFNEAESYSIAIISLLSGLIIAVSLYSLFIFTAVKDTAYVYYSIYALCFFVFYIALKGFGHQFIWISTPEASEYLIILFMGLALAALCLFNIKFLRIKQQHFYIYRLLRILLVSSLILAFASGFMPHIQRVIVGMVLAVVVCFTSIYVAIDAVKRQVDGSKRFLIGWLIFSCGVLIMVGNRSGLIERSMLTEYAFMLGQLASFIVIFHALMGRVRLARIQIVAAQDKAMRHYQMFHDIYQHAVEAHYTTTEDGRIVRGNKAFVELLKYNTIEELLAEDTNMAHFYLDVTAREQLVKQAKELGTMIGYEAQWRRRDGRNIWVSINLRYQPNTIDGNVLIGSIIDITEKKRAEKQLEFMATHDALTGIYNRREFEKRLNTALCECKPNVSHTLLYMDLDQFKVVNDTCGHKAGDILLRQLTDEMRDVVDDKGVIARLGGDEFGVLLENCIGDAAFVIAYQIKQVVQEFRFVWDSRVFTVGVSIGMVEVNENNHSIDEVLSIADTACFTAKEKGRNRIHSYTESDEDVKRHHAEMEQVTQINKALEEDRFFLEFQMIMPIAEHDKFHYELLIRMQGENGERIPPGLFLPAAERYNLMAQIDQWVINHYFSWLQANPEHLEKVGKCAINLSGPSLADDDMQIYILNAFETYQVPYEKICFEITESLAITQLDKTLAFIKTFRNLGCRFSLDDFGSGFSSYGYLKNLPVDYLKIDGAFVKDMLIDPIDHAMVKSINEVAKAIGMKTIAEFVESEEILLDLKAIGVDYAQGYFVNKPKPIDHLKDL
ncbi:EAL domain-containing protein [Saccharobesus litoralis]|uniref:EAL domain-containing protein n=1 Tax=Saccharobesus litoralis TaxID=2172099 RepID=UPI00131EE38C|nr:EAL domain-containing protein [Saccharobesus litoralis]